MGTDSQSAAFCFTKTNLFVSLFHPEKKSTHCKLRETFQATTSFTGKTFYWGQDFGKMRRNSDCNMSNVRTYKQHLGSLDRFIVNHAENAEQHVF